MRDDVRKVWNSAVAIVLLAMILGAPSGGVCQDNADFREIISRAKSEIFPALIFVKPIVAEYSHGEKRRQEIFGSGVIISPDGCAVTNHHVVDKAVG